MRLARLLMVFVLTNNFIPAIFSQKPCISVLQVQEYNYDPDNTIRPSYLHPPVKKDCYQLLQLHIYNGQEWDIPVTSTLLVNDESAVLIDVQDTYKGSLIVNHIIESAKKPLKLVIISCPELEDEAAIQDIKWRYPGVEITTLPTEIYCSRKINTNHTKLPERFAAPIITQANFSIDGLHIETRNRDSYGAYVWLPENDIIIGSVGIYWGMHVLVVNARDKEIRLKWQNTLEEMIALEPVDVIPGHYFGLHPKGDAAIRFTLEYLRKFESLLIENDYRNSAGVIRGMLLAYPDLKVARNLIISAQVIARD
ncbi:uncharacterized protein LOC135843832 [Planococcus citri]|uniref:uncharacterized protein LOC135843832 n=1 Tax=Planococcus citri TaxID=170843 RepID=UPI0031F944A5